MREIIHDIVKHTGSLGFIEEVKITGTDELTMIEAMDNDKLVFIKGSLNVPLPEFNGTFGIKSLPLLNGLCNFANYKSDGASLKIKTRDHGGAAVPEELQFRDASGSGADFRLVNADLIEPQADIKSDIKWLVEFEPHKSKIQEFAQLASLYAEFEKWFGVKTKNGDLIFTIGDEGSAAHRANMVFESNIVEKDLVGDLYWPTSQILSILKLAGTRPATMSFASTAKAGMLRVTINSDHGVYHYLFPTRRK